MHYRAELDHLVGVQGLGEWGIRWQQEVVVCAEEEVLRICRSAKGEGEGLKGEAKEVSDGRRLPVCWQDQKGLAKRGLIRGLK